MAQREVVFVRSSNFLEPRYKPPQGSAMHLCPNRIMIGQLQFLLVLPNPLTNAILLLGLHDGIPAAASP